MRGPWAAAVLLVATAGGCASLQQVLALRNVDFHIRGVSDVRLAGVDLSGVRGYEGLSLSDAARLAQAISARDLPMELSLRLVGDNPAENPTDARLLRMDWTLLLDERETVSGVFEEEVVMPAGASTEFPLTVDLDLIDFFEGTAPDLLELALAIAGQGGETKEVTVLATPTIDTALGPMRYPGPVTIARREMGATGR